MLQVQLGDEGAASTLIRRNFGRVSCYVGRLVRDRRTVEDLTQDVFVQVLSHAEQYRPTAKFTTWLYRIATNAALKYLEQAYVRLRVPDASGSEFEVSDTSEARPDERMSVDELAHRVADAIAALPANQRVALTLFEYEDFTYEQIAAILNVSVEAVRSLLLRARTTLRRELRGLA